MTSVLAAVLFLAPAASAKHRAYTGSYAVEDLKMNKIGDDFQVSLQFVLDSLRLSANHQMFVTPVVEQAGVPSVAFPTLLICGRNMHYAYGRGLMPKAQKERYDIYREVRRMNGTSQQVDYTASVPMEEWMMSPDTRVTFLVDTCGCGALTGTGKGPVFDPQLNPLPRMRSVFITPKVTPQPIIKHEGKARVQFEVDRTQLHDSVYRCKNGQKIDNRAELQVIYDSITYAQSDPNVEITGIDICGYASPESPYLHNEELATGRSRALAEFIADRFKLPREICTYHTVAENWGEFKEMVEKSDVLTAEQKADLLALINRPAYGPTDYDAKEKELKTSPKFANLYKTLILPKWFPMLRATKFSIETQLKPMPDEQLAEVLAKSPEKLSLNQIFRVARLYPEGSPEFNEAIAKALKYYPKSEEANLNAAIALIRDGKYGEAETLLEKAGTSPEAENARGIIAVWRNDLPAARSHFEAASPLPEAVRNIESLPISSTDEKK